ncbi:enoyl-CoA hydratase [Pseudonocardia sulfidoxydans NBRC 16205]|uniref:Enoyl-CoA hydratase n=1 Tax=Pseudonocardia sulfidoxydans NBRC 16205 TaxID=1223511 RepID=A0A511D9Z5_9PSEU|nr:enoyl-CoA hydratase/isomerase family protein [Pseudonocardia sulfidoxydans]GEL21616.1 enoyl-CoA hydratase [Pseudonocardia sulfidoxydans NBRC 16205]
MTEPDPVLVAHADGVARVTFNRPDHANTITYATMQAFIAGLEQAHASGATVLVVSGAGADLTLGRDKGERVAGVTRADNLRLILHANELLASFPGISVAAVRGRAFGFGTGLALHSDIAIAADTAILGFDELAAGLPPLVVLTYLYRHVTPKAADDLVLTSRKVGAAEALRLGLVSRVVAEADLDATVERTVAELAGRDASALRLLKEFAGEAKSAEQRPAKEFGEYAVERLVAWIERGQS